LKIQKFFLFLGLKKITLRLRAFAFNQKALALKYQTQRTQRREGAKKYK